MNIEYYCWANINNSKLYTKSETPSIGDPKYTYQGSMIQSGTTVSVFTPAHEGTGPNGRGVIYRLIDEWNNDVGYDFKNIQFLMKNNWIYTIPTNVVSPDDISVDASVFNDGFVVNNYIRKQINDLEGGEILGGNILIHGMDNSIIGVRSRNNIIIRGNTILIDCVNTRSVKGDSILVGCGDFTPEESGYYLMNKKILTETES